MKTVMVSFIFIVLSFNIACAHEPKHESRSPVVNFEKNSEGFFVNKSDAFYLRYMWESFVALNWPNKTGERDAPDEKQIPVSRAPLVWETCPQPQEVFLLPDQWKNFPDFILMSYLPSKARFPGQKINVSVYSCNNPASQPFNQD